MTPGTNVQLLPWVAFAEAVASGFVSTEAIDSLRRHVRAAAASSEGIINLTEDHLTRHDVAIQEGDAVIVVEAKAWPDARLQEGDPTYIGFMVSSFADALHDLDRLLAVDGSDRDDAPGSAGRRLPEPLPDLLAEVDLARALREAASDRDYRTVAPMAKDFPTHRSSLASADKTRAELLKQLEDSDQRFAAARERVQQARAEFRRLRASVR